MVFENLNRHYITANVLLVSSPPASPSCVCWSVRVIEKLNAVDLGQALMDSAQLSTEVYFFITRENDTHEKRQVVSVQ